MATSYPEQLGEWVKQRKSTRTNVHLVAFLAVRNDVKAALDAGYSVKTVWQNMTEKKRITISYGTFLIYVHRSIRRPQEQQAAALAALSHAADSENSAAQSAKATKKELAKKTAAKSPANFNFNPSMKKEDLI